MRGFLLACLCAGVMLGAACAAEPVKPEIVAQGVQALQRDFIGSIRASESPWDIDDPTKDTLFIERAADNPRVLAIARKLGIPHERIFVNLVMPYGSMSDGRNAMIANDLVMDGTELQLAFFIAHEYAHGYLNHRLTASQDVYREQLAYCPDCTDPKDLVATVKAGFDNEDLTAFRERRKRLELDADEWAARRVAQHYAVPSAESFFELLVETEDYTRDTDGDTHYSRNRRVAAVEAVLARVSCRDCAKN